MGASDSADIIILSAGPARCMISTKIECKEVEKCKSINLRRSQSVGETLAITVAARHRNNEDIDVVLYLLSGEADVNAQDGEKHTVFMEVVQKHRVGIVRLLLHKLTGCRY